MLIDISDHEQSMQVLPCYSYLQLVKNEKRSALMNLKKIKEDVMVKMNE